MKKVLLLDANNLIYRARYSAKFAREGDAAVVYSFFRSLKPILEKFEPHVCYFVRDGARANREDLLPGYKANRTYDKDQSFLDQKRKIEKSIREHFPIIVARDMGLEADDIIGYLVKEKHADDECVVVSSDTDFIQLLQQHENCLLYNPITKKFREKPSYDYVTWKSLRGDGADNIPGIPRVGDKTAEKLSKDQDLLNKFLDENVDRRNTFERNVELISLKNPKDSKDVSYSDNILDKHQIVSMFRDLNFHSMLKESYLSKYFKVLEKINENFVG